jgi:hypothetical protein
MDIKEQDKVKIKVPNTKFWVLGEKMTRDTWNMFLTDQQSSFKQVIQENISTKSFVIFSNVILKTPFPYNEG